MGAGGCRGRGLCLVGHMFLNGECTQRPAEGVLVWPGASGVGICTVSLGFGAQLLLTVGPAVWEGA